MPFTGLLVMTKVKVVNSLTALPFASWALMSAITSQIRCGGYQLRQ